MDLWLEGVKMKVPCMSRLCCDYELSLILRRRDVFHCCGKIPHKSKREGHGLIRLTV